MTVITLQNESTGEIQVFKNLKDLCGLNPEYKYHTLLNWLSRRGEPYNKKGVKIEKHTVQRLSEH